MLMDIDVRQLRSFVTIYERGSLSRAAEHLACTQAAMSMRLKWLESEMGEALFLRQHHKLEPTFKGTEFYARALVVLAAYDEMISVTRSTLHRSKVKIGIPDDYALGFLPQALRAAKSASAQMEIEIVCDLSANLAAALNRQEVDLAIVTLASRPVQALATIDVPLKWVKDPAYVPAAGRPIGLVAYPEGCLFRRAMIEALDETGTPWAVLAQSRNRAGIVSALRGKLGVSAMALGTVPHDLMELMENAWLPSLPSLPISILASDKALSSEGRQLAEALKAALEQASSADASPIRESQALSIS